MNTIIGSWHLRMKTPLGTIEADYQFAETDGELVGTAAEEDHDLAAPRIPGLAVVELRRQIGGRRRDDRVHPLRHLPVAVGQSARSWRAAPPPRPQPSSRPSRVWPRPSTRRPAPSSRPAPAPRTRPSPSQPSSALIPRVDSCSAQANRRADGGTSRFLIEMRCPASRAARCPSRPRRHGAMTKRCSSSFQPVQSPK